MNDKLLTLLGFAAKAGKLSYGAKAATDAAATKKARVVIICNDISEKSRKEMMFQCGRSGVRAIVLDDYDKETVSGAVGRSCGILSVNDSLFSEQLIKLVSVHLGGNANDE